jgi:hypothetical protein
MYFLKSLTNFGHFGHFCPFWPLSQTKWPKNAQIGTNSKLAGKYGIKSRQKNVFNHISQDVSFKGRDFLLL